MSDKFVVPGDNQPIGETGGKLKFIGHLKNIEFHAEFFNHVNFANPISNPNALASSGGSIDSNTGRIINPGDFGRITATSNNRG